MIKDKELLLKYRSQKSLENYNPIESCPCCGYITLEGRGENLVCPVCFWEDEFSNEDSVTDQDYVDGPNHITLKQAQENFEKFGACREDLVQHVVTSEDRDKIFQK